MTHKQRRVEKIRAAKTALEAEPRGGHGREPAPSDRPRRGRPAKNPPGTPPDRAQRHFTDPDSRMMKARDGFIHGDTAHAVVDAAHQVMVAQGLTNQASDAPQREPMLASIKANRGRQARELSADAGYGSEHTLTALHRRHIRGYVATGRQPHGATSAVGRGTTVPRTRVHAMKIRLKRAGYRSRDRVRKQVVEPVCGQIKHARGFRQFLRRGQSQVAGEWSWVCRTHPVLKLAGARG